MQTRYQLNHYFYYYLNSGNKEFAWFYYIFLRIYTIYSKSSSNKI